MTFKKKDTAKTGPKGRKAYGRNCRKREKTAASHNQRSKLYEIIKYLEN